MLTEMHTGFLFASLFWGSVGVGYWIYGKRQQSFGAMGGGIVMVLVSYFIGSVFVMSLVCLAAAVVVYFLSRRGY